MKHKLYYLNKEKTQKLELIWDKGFRETKISLNDKPFGSVNSKEKLEQGKSFTIGQDKLFVRLEGKMRKYINVEVNDIPVYGSPNNPISNNRRQSRYLRGFAFFVMFFGILIGMKKYEALTDVGFGFQDFAYGVLFYLATAFYMVRPTWQRYSIIHIVNVAQVVYLAVTQNVTVIWPHFLVPLIAEIYLIGIAKTPRLYKLYKGKKPYLRKEREKLERDIADQIDNIQF